ncbi:MAG: GDP-mannose 4,6-dehydratase [Gemmatimonadota bacterium]|nr:GDP-mannose 4,6-dehydratase [Gemmatimonadota bacterium]
MARVLVTGGAGFIGSHVADRFLAAGNRVVIADNLSSGKRENLPRGAEFHELDIGSPQAAQLVRDGAFDIVAHLAAQIDVRRSVDDPVFDARVNILGTLNLAEALRSSPSARRTRIVFASTGGALYGDFVAPPSPEASPKDPDSPYGISKLSVEHYLAYYGRVHGLNTVVLRFGNVYGPRQDPHGEAGVVAIFCRRLLDGRPLTIFGDGRQTRDYIYVGDVASAFLAAAAAPLSPPERLDARAFNVGTGVETSVIELAEMLRRVAGGSAPIQFAPKRPGELARSVLAPDKAAEQLGWTAVTPLERGLAETYAWFAARPTAPAVT